MALYANTSLTMAQAAYINAARRRQFNPYDDRARQTIDIAFWIMSERERYQAADLYLTLRYGDGEVTA